MAREQSSRSPPSGILARQRGAAPRRLGIACCRGMDWLKSVHFYRKVPSDLTEATLAGGTLSLLALIAMAYLFFSNVAAFLQERQLPAAAHAAAPLAAASAPPLAHSASPLSGPTEPGCRPGCAGAGVAACMCRSQSCAPGASTGGDGHVCAAGRVDGPEDPDQL